MLTLGNKVWSDLNSDGIQNDGEPGIPGVTVNLYYSGATSALATAITFNFVMLSFALTKEPDLSRGLAVYRMIFFGGS